MRWLVVSTLVHALVLALLIEEPRLYEWHPPMMPVVERRPTMVEIVIEAPPKTSGGGGGGDGPVHHAARRSHDAWQQVSMSFDRGGQGQGQGQGQGITGTGVGFTSVRVPDDVPAAPPAPRVSRARPARLIWPNRDEEVDDDANLFTARITVDSHGDVIGARMLTVRPGAKAERAASAIWTFRYSPALDDDGRPVNSTLDQSFQVR